MGLFMRIDQGHLGDKTGSQYDARRANPRGQAVAAHQPLPRAKGQVSDTEITLNELFGRNPKRKEVKSLLLFLEATNNYPELMDPRLAEKKLNSLGNTNLETIIKALVKKEAPQELAIQESDFAKLAGLIILDLYKNCSQYDFNELREALKYLKELVIRHGYDSRKAANSDFCGLAVSFYPRDRERDLGTLHEFLQSKDLDNQAKAKLLSAAIKSGFEWSLAESEVKDDLIASINAASDGIISSLSGEGTESRDYTKYIYQRLIDFRRTLSFQLEYEKLPE